MFKKFIKGKKLTRYVHFAGFIDNNELSKFLAAADVYISSSLTDGTSLSLLEAMSCGLPIIVTDIPSNREWITNGKNGFLVQRKDPKVLSDKIIQLLKDKALMKMFGERNYQISKERADWDKNFIKLEKIYKKLKKERQL